MSSDPYYKRLKRAEALVLGDPSQDAASELIRLLKDPQLASQLFSSTLSRDWLTCLADARYFEGVEARIEVKPNEYRFPTWTPVLALHASAPVEPEVVWAIMQAIPKTDNDWVNGHLMDIALKLPTKELAAKWAEREAARLEGVGSLHLWYPVGCRKMVERLAEEHEHKACLILAAALLELRAVADPRPALGESLAKARGATFEGERRTTVMKVSQHEYAEITAILVDKLTPHLGMQVLDELATLLDFALANDGYPKEPPDDHSYIWKASISEDERHYAGDAHELLVSPVRDAALKLADNAEQTTQVLAFLFERKWRVFWRIGLYVAAKTIDPDNDDMRRLVMDQQWGRDWAKYPEYFNLLRHAFSGMTDEEKSHCLAWVEQYPNLDTWKANFKESRRRDPTDDDVNEYKAYRSVRALWRIRDILPPDWKAKYEAWSSMQGGGEAAEIESMPKGIRTVGGPKRADELEEMTVDEVLDFLNTWEPDTSFHSSSHWAPDLARNVSPDVKRRHRDYMERFDRLLEMRDPTWCAAVMSGLRDAELDDVEWASVLHFCGQLVAWGPDQASPKAEQFPNSDFARSMMWCRMTILEFLKQGLYTTDDHPGRPFAHKDEIWEMLKELSKDPDPRADDAVMRNDDPDYDMTALNRVRPQVVETAIWFGIWYVHNTKSPEERSERAKGSSIDDVPELGDLLSHHINKSTEPHPSVWAIYGQHFARLLYLGRDWVEEHLDEILPTYEADDRKRSIVWRSFIKHYRGDWTTSEFMHGKFLEEVERLDSEPDEATDDSGRELDNRLALHLMVMFWWRAINLDGQLLSTFFERAPDSVRAYAIWYLGNQYNDFLKNPDKKNDATDLLRELWVARNQAAEAKGGKGFEQEMGAFLKFFTAGGPVHTGIYLDRDGKRIEYAPEGLPPFNRDHSWVLDRLIESLTWAKSSRAMYDTDVAKKFASYADGDLKGKAIRALRLLVESHRADFGLPYWLADADDLIKAAVEADDEDAREECYRLINVLGSVGIDKYRSLLPQDRGGLRVAEQQPEAKPNKPARTRGKKSGASRRKKSGRKGKKA
ncbi:MAG: hypothetical protein H6839_02715 [Planctomycetes bacterium]|nr:hypothetical protein [Planctomycetota bacterium]